MLDYSKMKLSAFADEYSPNLEEQLLMLHEEGIKFIEPRFINGKQLFELNDEEIEEFKRLLDKYQIGISSMGSPIGKMDILDDFSEHLKKAEKIFKIANVVGAKNVRMFSFYNYNNIAEDEFEKKVFAYLEILLDTADKYGLVLCHENESKIYGESYDNCLKLLKHFNGRLKAVFDMANFVVGGYDTVKAYQVLKEHIEYFHIKDALFEDVIVPAKYGEGYVQEIVTMALKDINHDFFLTVEPHLQVFSGLGFLAAKGSKLSNKYKFPTQKEAFMAGINATREMMESIKKEEFDVEIKDNVLIKKYKDKELLINDISKEISLYINTIIHFDDKVDLYFEGDIEILNRIKNSEEIDLSIVNISNELDKKYDIAVINNNWVEARYIYNLNKEKELKCSFDEKVISYLSK